MRLDDELWKWINTRAKQAGVTASALVRDVLRERYVRTENAIGVWKNRSDLGETREYVRGLRHGTRLRRFAR